MGIVMYSAKVVGPKGEEVLEFLVDTGSQYTLLPSLTWRKLGLKPKRKESFSLADGTRITRSMSECQITIEKMEGYTPVILGEEEDEALLGVITLEEFGLLINPFTRKLQPMRMMLARRSQSRRIS